MSGNQPMEEMVRNWTEMQQRMWDTWLQTVRGMQMPTGVSQADDWQQHYQQNLEAWEKAVREALDAQVQWAQKWAQQAGAGENASEGMQEAVKQTQEMMKSWTEAQSKLWNAWFDSVKNMDPSRMAEQWDSEGQRVLKAWQDATKRAQEAMQELSGVAATGGSGQQKSSAGRSSTSGGTKKA
ncbi:hypothetical protein [Halorhodospira halophila]|uniref:Phasin domain-containing protein n=1 Tax=Halorhodospira halophila (strain DSM 244 / SL1) TaxID=349124 RepID=A1WW10_HALHL|nr:hypothetical protein [Halorhodospira halophila]ABM61872.1 conserved hypothetical protein [Halorhodospira halophila SL1]MBK1729858.1 hypothetical protein [Halorhodospira halophila]